MKYIVGIDPGLSGAITFIREDGALSVVDMPTAIKTVSGKKKRSIDRNRLREIFDRDDILHVIMELQGTRPGQSAQSTVSTSRHFGLLEGVVLANYHPYTIIAPLTWKKALRVPKDKKESMARASELMPRCAHKWANAGHDGRAESAMLALYGINEILKINIHTITPEA